MARQIWIHGLYSDCTLEKIYFCHAPIVRDIMQATVQDTIIASWLDLGLNHSSPGKLDFERFSSTLSKQDNSTEDCYDIELSIRDVQPSDLKDYALVADTTEGTVEYVISVQSPPAIKPGTKSVYKVEMLSTLEVDFAFCCRPEYKNASWTWGQEEDGIIYLSPSDATASSGSRITATSRRQADSNCYSAILKISPMMMENFGNYTLTIHNGGKVKSFHFSITNSYTWFTLGMTFVTVLATAAAVFVARLRRQRRSQQSQQQSEQDVASDKVSTS